MSPEVTLPGRLSYSSLSSYAECGEKWRLERLHKLPLATWWATVAGKAVHSVTEKYDLGELALPTDWYDGDGTLVDASEARESVIAVAFELAFAKEEQVERAKKRPINASGRVLKEHGAGGGPNKKDRDWWSIEGPKMIESYIAWRQLTKWELPVMPDGRPAVEIPLPVEFAGRDQLGFIDRVFLDGQGNIIIVDLKSGNLPPGKTQLGVYAVALRRLFGIDADYGTFWHGATGDIVTPMYDLTGYTDEYVDHLFDMAWHGIEAGVFLPNVTGMCKGCTARDWCRAVGGKMAVTIPVSDVLVEWKGRTASPRLDNAEQM